MGSGLCPWSLTVALHVLLNSGVEAALMCLDLLGLPSGPRTPHVETTNAHIHFDSLSVHTHDDQRYSKQLKLGMEFSICVSPKGRGCASILKLIIQCREVRRYSTQPQLT
ncbi:hypothetical protein M9H77_07058 [Catharanthus roseus]|uniref:Uncharacterized protein n=1 Tax=Catharanthus roseus TaxID=4058 RepID=A0ACC0BU89_CATRO|nr:hypothetical protein M9H77_07058 [Catharanthus roseus]